MTELPPIPLMLRTRLAHATLQAIADDCGADVLHIKGAAVDPSLLPMVIHAGADAILKGRTVPRLSSDADVLVRPSHLKPFMAALRQNGWQAKSRFYSKGAFEHSTDWRHDELGWADVHCRFPGIHVAHDEAFNRLWHERHSLDIAHRPCSVPSVDAQRLILLLHAARNGLDWGTDVRSAWTDVTAAEQDRVRALARQLRAEMPLAAATGHLEDFASHPGYDLWKLFAEHDSRALDRWVASIKAASTHSDRVRILLFPFRVKADRLEKVLGRQATMAEILRSYGNRLFHGAIAVTCMAVRRTADLVERFRSGQPRRLR